MSNAYLLYQLYTSEFLYVRFAEDTCTMSHLFRSSSEILLELTFLKFKKKSWNSIRKRKKKDQRVEMQESFVEVSKCVIHNTRSKENIGFYFITYKVHLCTKYFHLFHLWDIGKFTPLEHFGGIQCSLDTWTSNLSVHHLTYRWLGPHLEFLDQWVWGGA